jgi:hypothetical protein
MLRRQQQRTKNWELDRKVVRVDAKDVVIAVARHRLFNLPIFLVLEVFRESVLRA